ncbi:hypothetical protein EHP00_1694 [Ecytonucleospora hepatopenaei]|uniref:Uncharacterized protein n=1 Tax=Ecytonucleospora hepatopenaei TaxID=646526 RepID=A0A1W0E495_9MICR|nr:hypothetical protein EHP00_1694 [Ecytonucleospora hepatopenaei]
MFSYYNEILEPVFTGSHISVVEFFRNKGMLKRDLNCPCCKIHMKTVEYSRNCDKMAFKCINSAYSGYKKYHSVLI